MLAFFRRALSSWAVLGLLGLLMVAFIVTGVGTPSSMGALGGLSSSELVRVGNRSLSSSDVAQRMQLELRQAREQQPELTMAQLLQSGTLEQMVTQMTDLLSLRAFGEAHGMAVS
ncbi:MAG: SurA N-terminal domain-containing protein, partial [Alphaproteobacteria bacterium]|nr:SurA N-terminal domain-containing protein [Alphaproteobacteria bacterium]